MAALGNNYLDLELENGHGVKMGCVEGDGGETMVSIEDAVRVLLEGLGEDVEREGIKKTPLRVAKALREGTRGYKQKVKDIVEGALFPEVGLENGVVGHEGGGGGLVLVRDLDLFSYCESCLLPFQVKCHVGYVPSGQRVVGLSKLSRVADIFAKRLQEPQRLAQEVCLALNHGIKPSGVVVVLQCLHIHLPDVETSFLDSKHQGWLKAVVSAGSRVFENEDASVWTDFFSLLKFRGIDVEKIRAVKQSSWCSSAILPNELAPVNPRMVFVVALMIQSLGEDPSRKELVETPTRYVKWLMNFKNDTNLEMKLNGYVSGRRADVREKYLHSELNLSFWSQCEHHLLPFHGVVHIGYFNSKGFDAIGKSCLQSIVHFYGFKLQVQERMTRQIAETVSSIVGGDIMVVVEASHTCMISRGIEKFGSSTVTIAVLGLFSSDADARAAFSQTIPNTDTTGRLC